MIGQVVSGCVAAVLFPQQATTLIATSAVVGVWNAFEARRKRAHPTNNEVDPNGPPPAVSLAWKDLTATLHKKRGSTVKLLDGVSGCARPGRLLAIMGPSGAGKTTLLNAVSGRVPTSDGIDLKGVLAETVEKDGPTPRPHRMAYVRQKPLFFSQLTVRETLVLAATLQLPKTVSDEEKRRIAESLMNKLGLGKCADTIVGNDKSRGISGGEMKRLSLACELISAPSVVFADEPTSGLDSFAAEKVMRSMRTLANDGRTVVCSIHQPSGTVFTMFDDLLLLADGKLVYMGPAKDVLAYFGRLGYDCPPYANPAEFLSDLISVDFSNAETEEESRRRIQSLTTAFEGSNMQKELLAMPQLASKPEKKSEVVPSVRIGWFGQFRLLLSRAWRQVRRDKKNNMARLIPSITSALLFGTIYWRLKLTQAAAMDRMGLLQVASINTAMLSLVKTLYVFPNERTIVNEERSKGSYEVLPYFVSKLCAELPVAAIFPGIFATILYPMAGLHGGVQRYARFLSTVVVHSFACASFGLTISALAPSTEAAVAVGPASMVIFIVFGGYYLNEASVPKLLRFLPDFSIIRWTFQALCLNEFRGLKFETKAIGDAATGEMFLERLSFVGSSVDKCAMSQLRFLVANYAAAYTILRLKTPQYVKVAEEVGDEEVRENGRE